MIIDTMPVSFPRTWYDLPSRERTMTTMMCTDSPIAFSIERGFLDRMVTGSFVSPHPLSRRETTSVVESGWRFSVVMMKEEQVHYDGREDEGPRLHFGFVTDLGMPSTFSPDVVVCYEVRSCLGCVFASGRSGDAIEEGCGGVVVFRSRWMRDPSSYDLYLPDIVLPLRDVDLLSPLSPPHDRIEITMSIKVT
jgi:hypothetical protein